MATGMFGSFSSFLMLLDDLKPETINEVFRNEQLTRNRHIVSAASSMAMAAATSTSNKSPQPKCNFCGIPGHILMLDLNALE